MESINAFYEYFGVHDAVLVTLGLFLYQHLRKVKNKSIQMAEIVLYFLLFSYLFPDFAAAFETQRVFFFEEENGDLIDGFNLLYVWARFPTYWILGISFVVIDRSFRKYKLQKSIV